jgi:hypothetical protein
MGLAGCRLSRWTVSRGCGAGGIHHADPELGRVDPFDGADRGPRLPHQSGRIGSAQEKRERHLAVVRDHEVADHAGREDVILEAWVLNAGQRRGNAGLEFGTH